MPRSAEARSLPADQLRFSEVLSAAISRRNLTLERIGARLREAGTPVSIATLSYWQTGRSLPTRARSMQAVEQLERLLRVPVGHLTGALPRDSSGNWEQVTDIPFDQRPADALMAIGIRSAREFSTHWIQDDISINADFTQQREDTRQFIRATTDGLDRIPLLLDQVSTDETTALISAEAGCELGRVVQLEEQSLVAAELLLPHPLALGEPWTLHYRVTRDCTDDRERGYRRRLTTSIRLHVLTATFEGRQPATIGYVNRPTGQDEAHELRQELITGPFVQIALPNPTRGVHGLSWTL